MRTSRFNRDFDQKLPARWTRLSDLSAPRISKRRKFFAIVSPPIRIDAGRKPVRRILIYDNHPATLRLLHDVDAAREERSKFRYAILASALTIILIAAVLWLLL